MRGLTLVFVLLCSYCAFGQLFDPGPLVNPVYKDLIIIDTLGVPQIVTNNYLDGEPFSVGSSKSDSQYNPPTWRVIGGERDVEVLIITPLESNPDAFTTFAAQFGGGLLQASSPGFFPPDDPRARCTIDYDGQDNSYLSFNTQGLGVFDVTFGGYADLLHIGAATTDVETTFEVQFYNFGSSLSNYCNFPITVLANQNPPQSFFIPLNSTTFVGSGCDLTTIGAIRIVLPLENAADVSFSGPIGMFGLNPSQTPSRTPSISETPSPTPSVSLSATSSRTPSISETPTSSISESPSPTITPSFSRSPTASVSETPSVTLSPTSSRTPTPTVSETPSVTLSPTSTRTPTASQSDSPSPTITPSSSRTPSQTSSYSPSPTITGSPTRTVSITPTVSESISITASISISPTKSRTPSVSASATISESPSPTPSQTQSDSASSSVTPSVTRTPSITKSSSVTPSVTKTKTASITKSPNYSRTPTPTKTLTPSTSTSRSASKTASTSRSPSRSRSHSRSPSLGAVTSQYQTICGFPEADSSPDGRSGPLSIDAAFDLGWSYTNPNGGCTHLATYDTEPELKAIIASMTAAGVSSAIIGGRRVTLESYQWDAGSLRGTNWIEPEYLTTPYATREAHCTQETQFCLTDMSDALPITDDSQIGMVLLLGDNDVPYLVPSSGASCFTIEAESVTKIASVVGNLPYRFVQTAMTYDSHQSTAIYASSFIGQDESAEQTVWIQDELQCGTFNVWLGYENTATDTNLRYGPGLQQGTILQPSDATACNYPYYCNFASNLAVSSNNQAVQLNSATGLWSLQSRAGTASAIYQREQCNAGVTTVGVCLPQQTNNWLVTQADAFSAASFKANNPSAFTPGGPYTFVDNGITYLAYFTCRCTTDARIDLSCLGMNTPRPCNVFKYNL